MIPLTATIAFRWPGRGPHELWIPLALVWLPLLPVAVLLLPCFAIACLIGEVNPWRAIGVIWNVLAALNDTWFRVEQPELSLSVHLF